MDIYRAAGYPDGSDGVSPASYVFDAMGGQILMFSSVSGKWTCAKGIAPFGPDGATSCPMVNFAGSVGPFSGYTAMDFQGALVGVFLEDTFRSPAPRASRFYAMTKSQGAISTGLSSSSQRVAMYVPLIGQIFFIGDGVSGTGAGSTQFFTVPETATHLYIGYVDSCSATSSVPGCYADNEGTLTAVFRLVSPNKRKLFRPY